jgi:hypothetical protein
MIQMVAKELAAGKLPVLVEELGHVMSGRLKMSLEDAAELVNQVGVWADSVGARRGGELLGC